MSKLVNFRIEKGTETSIRNQLNHDLRLGHIPKNIDKERVKDNITLIGAIKPTTVKEEIEARQTLVKEKTGRKAQANAEFFFAGIMTFSSTMTEDYKNNPEAFKKATKTFLALIERDYQVKAVSAVIHLDEQTPHIHLILDNINPKTGKGVRRRLSPSKLSSIQTTMGLCFSSMGYERGQPVEETLAKHIDFKVYNNLILKLKKLTEDIEYIEIVKDELAKNSSGVLKLVEYFKKYNGSTLNEEAKKDISALFTK